MEDKMKPEVSRVIVAQAGIIIDKRMYMILLEVLALWYQKTYLPLAFIMIRSFYFNLKKLGKNYLPQTIRREEQWLFASIIDTVILLITK